MPNLIRVIVLGLAIAALSACGGGSGGGLTDGQGLGAPVDSDVVPTATSTPEWDVATVTPRSDSPVDPRGGPGHPPADGCFATGCSGHVCADSHVVTTCEWRPEYGCYRLARCEIQPAGTCGWTHTDEMTQCLSELTDPNAATPPVSTPTPSHGHTDLPNAAADDQIILVGAYEGDAIASTTIAGQDQETGTARVVIEPGTAPLYVLLSSYAATIWRIEGDVSRVRQVVVFGSGPQGVTGIADVRVTVLANSDGPLRGYFYSVDSSDARRLRQEVEAALGRAVDEVFGGYEIGTIALPSGAVFETRPPAGTPPGFDEAAYWRYGLSFSPGGVVEIDPATVVATAPAERYEVLPQGFGLAQLVATGGLEHREGFFYIARAIPRFPAGLYGAHSVDFVLASGVPMPAGDPGHSCVISEETGQAIGAFSRCGFVEPPVGACTLPPPSADDEVVLFGAYEGDAMSSVSVKGHDEVTQTARVAIAPGDSPLYIVIASHNNVIWRFEGSIERVDRVALIGYGVQAITGIAAARISNNSGTRDCGVSFYDQQSPEAVAVRQVVTDALGRAVDVMAGAYSVGTVTLPAGTVTGSAQPSGVPDGLDAGVYSALGLRFNHGGLVDIDPNLVVSNSPAERYDVLPQGFGLAQLVGNGAVEMRGGDIFGQFHILRAIPRFPAGLHGAHLVHFILGTGVPMPDGDPGHSCVTSEETGLPLVNGFLCGIAGAWE